jgi:endoglucanase
MKYSVKRLFLFLTLIAIAFISSTEAAVNYTGVNLAGAEFAPDQLPGTYGTHYIYPGHDEVDYFIGKGMNVFRLPFLWERLQRTQFGDFDATELARIDDFVNYATGKGASVVLDPHNYARYYGVVIGTGNVPASAFADFWGRLASRYKSNSRVIFGLMNEPHDMGTSMPTELWRDDANAAIQAIRNAGATNLILVPGNGWTGAHSWNNPWYGTPNAQAMLGINDPSNNYAFEVHQYLDGNDFGGQYEYCSSSTIGSEKLVEFTNWLRQNGKRGFLGEFAGARNDTCYAALDNMLTYIDNNTDVWLGWTYWAGGPWWGEYMFTLKPLNGTDRPQMAPLSRHFALPSGGTPPPTPSSGTGLRGDYYNSVTPSGAITFTRTDATVNFDWGSDPGPGVGSDNFSVRWTGQVQPLYSETYTFYTVSDDGVRLWVNGTQVVNNWTDHPATENSGTVALTAGQRYDIRMEFYERSGGAVARLSWSSPTQPKQIIPASQLYPAAISQTNPPLVLDDFEGGTLSKWNTFSGPGSSITGSISSPGQVGNYGMNVNYSVTDWAGIEQLFNASRNWGGYNYLDFWFYGSGSGNRFRVELYDNGVSAASAERFEYQFTDDVSGWRHFAIPLNAFTRRGDWQPGGAPNDGLTLTQVWGFNFSPLGGSSSFRADQMQLTY